MDQSEAGAAASLEPEDWEEDVRKLGERQQEYSQKLEFGLKLGYSEDQVECALAKLGLDSDQNQLLAELIHMTQELQQSSKLESSSDHPPASGSLFPTRISGRMNLMQAAASGSSLGSTGSTSVSCSSSSSSSSSCFGSTAFGSSTSSSSSSGSNSNRQSVSSHYHRPLQATHSMPVGFSTTASDLLHYRTSSGVRQHVPLASSHSSPATAAAVAAAAAAAAAQQHKSQQQQQHHHHQCLRPIVIDGSNVAMTHGNRQVFSCRGISIAVNWFKARGHEEITVFVPMWRLQEPSRPDAPISDQFLLQELQEQRILVTTPSRNVKGRRVVCYDDRYVLNLAAANGGVVVSNDTYRDLVMEKPEMFQRVVEERQLMYTFVNDIFMPPEDPLGRMGPSLDSFLSFPPGSCGIHHHNRTSGSGPPAPLLLTHNQHPTLRSCKSASSSSTSSSPLLSSPSPSSSSCVNHHHQLLFSQPPAPTAGHHPMLHHHLSSPCAPVSSVVGSTGSSPVVGSSAAGAVAAGTTATAILCPYGKKCTYGNKCKYSHPERGNQPHKLASDRLLEQNRNRRQQQQQQQQQQQKSSLRLCHSLPLPLPSSSSSSSSCNSIANNNNVSINNNNNKSRSSSTSSYGSHMDLWMMRGGSAVQMHSSSSPHPANNSFCE